MSKHGSSAVDSLGSKSRELKLNRELDMLAKQSLYLFDVFKLWSSQWHSFLSQTAFAVFQSPQVVSQVYLCFNDGRGLRDLYRWLNYLQIIQYGWNMFCYFFYHYSVYCINILNEVSIPLLFNINATKLNTLWSWENIWKLN